MRSTLDRMFVFDCLVHQTVLNVDAAESTHRADPREVSQTVAGLLIGVVGEDAEELFRLRPENRRSQTKGVLCAVWVKTICQGVHQPGSFSTSIDRGGKPFSGWITHSRHGKADTESPESSSSLLLRRGQRRARPRDRHGFGDPLDVSSGQGG